MNIICDRLTHERTQQARDRDVVVLGLTLSEALQRIDACQSDGQQFACQHRCTLLVPLVQQTLLPRVGLPLRRLGLPVRYPAAPYSDPQGSEAPTMLAERDRQRPMSLEEVLQAR